MIRQVTEVGSDSVDPGWSLINHATPKERVNLFIFYGVELKVQYQALTMKVLLFLLYVHVHCVNIHVQCDLISMLRNKSVPVGKYVED